MHLLWLEKCKSDQNINLHNIIEDHLLICYHYYYHCYHYDYYYYDYYYHYYGYYYNYYCHYYYNNYF